MKTYVFDIDGTICSFTRDKTYNDVFPFIERIEQINKLAEEGHKIIFYTARGMGRTDDNPEAAKDLFYDLTIDQLNKWNVRYTKIFFGKPSGDYYIDDKCSRDDIFFGDKACP